MMTKDTARRKALDLRKLKNPAVCSVSAADRIVLSRILEPFTHIGIYYPIGREMNLLTLLNKYPDKCFYLPRTEKNISFIRYQTGDLLADGLFHTKEPVGKETERDTIECFLIPCVAVSKDKKRIGYGKGYYDKYLKGYGGMKLGICYSDSSGWDISCNEYDIAMDIVFTEKGIQ